MAYSNITISTNSGLSFRQYDFIQVTHDSDNYIIGRVVSYNSLNGELVFTPLVIKGSGSFSTWDVTSIGGNSYYMNSYMGQFKIWLSEKSSSGILQEYNDTKSRYGL